MTQIHTVFKQITTMLGSVFSLETLIRFVRLQRGRPLRVYEADLPVGENGYALVLEDTDVVCVRASLDDERRLLTLLHELSHVYLGHVRMLPYTCEALELEATVRFHIPHSAYAEPIERDAELLATLLYGVIKKHEQLRGIPSIGLPRVLGSE